MFCHEVMIKLRAGHLNEELLSALKEKVHHLREETDIVESAEIYFNCTKRNINYDLLLRVKLLEPETLNTYREDPVHLELSKIIEEHMVEIAAVDYIL